jgi:hypothetical protein
MKRLLAITSVMLLISAMFFVVEGAAGDPVTRPSKATWTGTTYVVGFCPDTTNFPVGAAQVINIGNGFSTATGVSEWFSEYCLYFNTPASLAGSGWGILTAANGDRIHTSIQVSADLTKDPVEWSETEFLVGGTGRFEGATGETVSQGTWTSGTDPFPFGEGIMPSLFQQPQGWEGTTKGWISK